MFLLTSITFSQNFINYPDSFIIINADEKKLVEAGKLAPELEMIDINGRTINLNSYRGKYLLLNIWQTNCAPCLANIPNIDSLITNYKDLEVINISTDKDSIRLINVISARNFKGIHIKCEDSDVPINYYILDTYRYIDKHGIFISASYPHYVLINKQGIIMYNNTKI